MNSPQNGANLGSLVPAKALRSTAESLGWKRMQKTDPVGATWGYIGLQPGEQDGNSGVVLKRGPPCRLTLRSNPQPCGWRRDSYNAGVQSCQFEALLCRLSSCVMERNCLPPSAVWFPSSAASAWGLRRKLRKPRWALRPPKRQRPRSRSPFARFCSTC